MIFSPAQNGEGPVNLLGKHDAEQLVRKRHLGKGDLLPGAVLHLIGKPEGASDHGSLTVEH